MLLIPYESVKTTAGGVCELVTTARIVRASGGGSPIVAKPSDREGQDMPPAPPDLPAPTPGSSIPIASVPNLRDLGGWVTRYGGHVQTGVLYRSAGLGKLQGGDVKTLGDLGIRSVYDMRTEAERTLEADRVPEGVGHVVVDVLADSSGAAPAQLLHLLGDPEAAAAMLGGGKAAALFEHAYREIVSLPSALAGYHLFFSALADPAHRPALFHCTGGKDRTGWAAAAMLMLLGVSDDDAMHDYLLTNDQLLPAVQPVFDAFKAAGGDPELLRPVLGVQQEYLEAALDEMQQRFGTLEAYFADGLKIDEKTQQTLRAAFIDRSEA
jgi:protein-tyrosine phosphatase